VLSAALVAGLLVAVAGLSAAGAPPARAADPTPSPSGATVLGSTVTFYGRGYGHGVGMSQYGARGRALAGQDSTAILGHYYQGATLGSIDPATTIRVLVLSKWRATSSVPLVIYGRLTTWTIDGVARTFPVDARLRVTPTTTVTTSGTTTAWRIRVEGADGAVLYSGTKPASLVVRGTSRTSRLQLWSKPSSYDTYRGALRIYTSSTAPTVSVVDALGIDTYLRGVVPAEMPSAWPTAALEAQSIASRSYAARRLRPGVGSYDVTDDTSSQVYRGVKAERSSTNLVILARPGVVLRSGSSIVNALYHSTGGGGTESNENVYTTAAGSKVAAPVSYLRGSLDRTSAGVAYDAGSPYATWSTAGYMTTQLASWFGADSRTSVGTLISLDLRNRGVSGRVISVTLIGSRATKTVSGEVFRSIFNVRHPATDPSMRSTLVGTQPIP
jgi:SpoIID/LytB domain protein